MGAVPGPSCGPILALPAVVPKVDVAPGATAAGPSGQRGYLPPPQVQDPPTGAREPALDVLDLVR